MSGSFEEVHSPTYQDTGDSVHKPFDLVPRGVKVDEEGLSTLKGARVKLTRVNAECVS